MPSAATNILQANGTFNAASPLTELHLADGRILHLPTSLLAPTAAPVAPTPVAPDPETLVIPLVEEQLAVTKRTVATGVVRLEKTVETFEATVQQPLTHINYRVDRVTLNQPVDAPPPVRLEGNTTIYPLLEEQLVLTRQLILKEEVRVTREQTEHPANQTILLRREHLDIQREALQPAREAEPVR